MATQPKPEQTIIDHLLERMDEVERRLGAVEIDLAVIKSNYATKEDIARLYQTITALEVKMAQLETRLIKWFVGTAITLSAVVGTIAFSVARFIH